MLKVTLASRCDPSFRMVLTDEELEVDWRKRTYAEMMESEMLPQSLALSMIEAPRILVDVVVPEDGEPD
ncbi:unnamed protein product [Linum trigynum]|uniref:Uncharacterized protein n=1 Tax=Linum trigynum TaxID=586398 RepID=A0AAV2G564_9ROSI